MKKILIAFFAFALCFSLCGICRAEQVHTATDTVTGDDLGNTEELELKEYITEKILPVIIGVATSSLGFVAVLGTISRSLKSLKDTKEAFSDEAKKRQYEFEKGCRALEDKAQELSRMVADVPELKDKLNELTYECALMAEILNLGFSANTEIIKSGKGKKMAMLLENAKCKMQGAKLTTISSTSLTPSLTQGRLDGECVENSEKEVG